MIDLGKKYVRFIDNGLFVDFARHVGKEFGKATYYCPYESYAPRSNQVCIGEGFDEMEKVKHALQDWEKVDLWVFLDLYHSDLQLYLEANGCRVYGGRCGEELELYRWEFKEYLRKIGLPVQRCNHIIGFDELREVLKKGKDKFVKTSFVRGDFETFRHIDYRLSEPRLDEMQHVLGPLGRNYEFIVEDDIPDAVEVGYDGFTVDGIFPTHAMMAYEIKDVGMIGTTMPYAKLAAPVRYVNSKLSETFRGYNYRGFLCTEIRYTKDKKPFLIDPCCRLGSPSNELLQVLFKGWAQTLWDGAEGKMTSPIPKAKFAVAAVIHSEWAAENWQALYYPKEVEEFVKLRFHVRVDGVDYTVPQPVGLSSPGVVLGVGDTLLEAVDHCKENAAEVKGYQCNVSLESIDEAVNVIKKGEEFGIKFMDGPMPTLKELARPAVKA